ncbi:MAG: hypothetical protein JWP88_1389 [Flaviaesturariibacter sp.]|nr:hypothetical protein [Flaviaesturariibacter sp.]
MESLFQTTLNYNGKATAYDVRFEQEAYIFQPHQAAAPVMRLKREEDEWHGATEADPSLRAAAISELDRYLLSQH